MNGTRPGEGEPGARNAPAAQEPDPGRGSLVDNILSNWIWYLFVLAAGFLFPRFIRDNQGAELLGVWDLTWTLVSYVELLRLGLSSATTSNVARARTLRDWDRLNAVVNSALAVLAACALVGLLAAAGLAAGAHLLIPGASSATVSTARLVILILAAGAALEIPGAVFNAVITGCQRYDVLNAIRIGADAAFMAVGILILLLGEGIVALALVRAGCDLLAIAARIVAGRRLLPELRFSTSFSSWETGREMVAFGSKAVARWMGVTVLFQANSLLVSLWLGLVPLAVYARQRALVGHAERILRQYAQVFTPASSSLHAAGSQAALQRLFTESSRYGFYLMFPVTVLYLVMGRPLLEVWMGRGFAAPLVLAILALGHLPFVSQQSAYMILLGIGKHGRPALFDVGAALVSLVLAVVFLGPLKLGLVGAALALAVPLVVSGGLLQPLYACSLLGLGFGRYIREASLGPAVASLPLAACLVAGRLLFEDSPILALAFGLGTGGPALAYVYWKRVVPASLRARIRALWPRALRGGGVD